MAVRNVATKNTQYVTIGGGADGVPEDRTKEYINILIQRETGAEVGNFYYAPVHVADLMAALVVEGFIKDFMLPEPPEKPLTQVERIAKALMVIADDWEYSIEEFREQEDYQDYIDQARRALDGDN